MKGRPRLVEEGIPLYGADTSSRVDADDHDMSSSPPSARHRMDHNSNSDTVVQVKSSLQAASKFPSMVPSRKVYHASAYTVGEDAAGESAHANADLAVHVPLTYQYEQPPNYALSSQGFTTVSSPWTNSIHDGSNSGDFQKKLYQHIVAPVDHASSTGRDDMDHSMNHIIGPTASQSYQVGDQRHHHNMYHQYQQAHRHHQSPPTQYDNRQVAPTHYSHPDTHASNYNTHASPQATSFVIGGSSQDQDVGPATVDRMEGVEDLSVKPPLVVIDGANVAYAYAKAKAMGDGQSSLIIQSSSGRIEPDVKGIQVAANYFLQAHLRVLVVLPVTWMSSKPRDASSRDNAKMVTPQLELLDSLHRQGLLVPAPPRDDDDAYALTIARRETAKARKRGLEHSSSGYVLSNDMFRDAVQRDASGELQEWLRREDPGPGRISYAFGNTGSMDDHGDPVLDFIPNPRHKLVAWVESILHQTHVH